MDFKNYKPEVQRLTLHSIFENLAEYTEKCDYPEDIEALGCKIINMLDDLDCDDFFGTEGWERHLL